MTLQQRVHRLKQQGQIAGYFEPHEHAGASAALTPWVIVPVNHGAATVIRHEDDLEQLVRILEETGEAFGANASHNRWVARSEMRSCPNP